MRAIFSESRRSHTGQDERSAGPVSDAGQQLVPGMAMRMLQAGIDAPLVNCQDTWSPVTQDLPEPAAIFFLCV